jgi:hypothetical protein
MALVMRGPVIQENIAPACRRQRRLSSQVREEVGRLCAVVEPVQTRLRVCLAVCLQSKAKGGRGVHVAGSRVLSGRARPQLQP